MANLITLLSLLCRFLSSVFGAGKYINFDLTKDTDQCSNKIPQNLDLKHFFQITVISFLCPDRVLFFFKISREKSYRE